MGGALLLGGVYTRRGMAVEPANEPNSAGGASAASATRGPRQKWTLTQDALDKFLASLGPDREAAGARYLEIRRNLVRLFEWRGCSTPDEYADETINRCPRKLAEGEEICDVAADCIGDARVFPLEIIREKVKQPRPLDEVREPQILPQIPEDDSERRVACLRQCL